MKPRSRESWGQMRPHLRTPMSSFGDEYSPAWGQKRPHLRTNTAPLGDTSVLIWGHQRPHLRTFLSPRWVATPRNGATPGHRGTNTVIGAVPGGQAANGFTVLPARSAFLRPGWLGMQGQCPIEPGPSRVRPAALEADRTECANRRGMDRRIPPGSPESHRQMPCRSSRLAGEIRVG